MSDETDTEGSRGSLERFRERLEPADILTSVADTEEVDAYLIETSYQLRTPLSAIIGYAELLMEDPADAEEVQLLAHSIRTATKSLMEVIQDLENQVMRERARRKISELLRSLSTMMTASLDFDEVVETIHSCLEEVIDFDRSRVLVNTEEGEYAIVAQREGRTTVHPDAPPVTAADDPRVAQIQSSLSSMVVADMNTDPRLDGAGLDAEFQSWLGVPLLWSDELIGILTLETREQGRFDAFDARLVSSLGTQAGLAIVNARQYSRARYHADVDGLTGAVTRRKFFEIAAESFEESRAQQTPVALLMIDLDHFKKVNDTYGHAAGDYVLHESIARCAQSIRPTDVIGRFGGEEFLVLLPGLEIDEARQVAERLRECVARESYSVGEHVLDVTVSIGVANLRDDIDTVARLVEEADVALYRAKRRGRDRVETAN